MKLLLRLDDLGFSEGVNFGIEKVVRSYPNLSIGMMMNMPYLQHGYDLIKAYDVCLGIHMNITAGKPLCCSAHVQSLVNELGDFHKASIYRKEKHDMICLQEAEMECEAQYQAFLEITGKKPSYIDVHAIENGTFLQAAQLTANRHNILFCDLGNQDHITSIHRSSVYVKVAQNSMNSFTKDLHELFLRTQQEENILVFHPGYADAYLMKHSSINIQRVYDVEALVSTEFQAYLYENNITFITYQDF